ncbi:MAG: response regulator [Planctomycetes bacterium]|nr:response regulator [Planctomycetota bacterium]
MSDKPAILVIEANPRVLDTIVRALEAAGFAARSAQSAMEGVRLARQLTPDLILADVELPDQDGATAMSCLKDNAEFNDVPLILVSALPHDQLVQKMSECGAVDIIQKPFEASNLVASVKLWLAAGEAPAPKAPEALPAPDRAGAVKKKAFEIATREISPGVGELKVVGSIGMSSLGHLEAGFNDLFGRKLHRIVVNLKETTTVFSAGIGCFLSARDEAMKAGGDLVFVSTPPDLRKLFAMLGISKILRSAETEESALTQLAGT